MTLPIGALRQMVEFGLSSEQILAIAEEMAKGGKERSANAERQARFRERKAMREAECASTPANDATDNVTSNVTLNPDKEVSPTPPSRNYPLKGNNITTREREAASDFDRFWTVYPRKVGKDDARKKFDAAIKAGASVVDLIAGVERDRHGQWAGRPPDMIPHPSTWLNQGRWKDEPPTLDIHPQGQRPNHGRPDPNQTRQSRFVERLSDIDRAMGEAVEQSSGRTGAGGYRG